jgi:peptide/nickel transport system ATP-binding protein/oligopeptide transport system ATP-binding protein
MEICKTERPTLQKHIVEGKEHFTACHLYAKAETRAE